MPVQSEYYLNLPGNLNIGVTSTQELPLGDNEALLLGAYLPEVHISEIAPDKTDVMLHHVESKVKGLRTGAGAVEVHDEWQAAFPADLPHLIYSIARSAWLQKGYCPTHAACVGKDEFTLLPGHSGVGKTTTALEAISQHGQLLVSGNTTLVKFDEMGNMNAVAGTRTMTLKTEDFDNADYAVERSVQYGSRTAFELRANQQISAPVKIGSIALVRLSDGLQEWTPQPSLSALHTLYPYFLDTEYADCIVAEGHGIYLGGTPKESRTQLVTRLQQALTKISVYGGLGDKDFLARKVAQA